MMLSPVLTPAAHRHARKNIDVERYVYKVRKHTDELARENSAIRTQILKHLEFRYSQRAADRLALTALFAQWKTFTCSTVSKRRHRALLTTKRREEGQWVVNKPQQPFQLGSHIVVSEQCRSTGRSNRLQGADGTCQSDAGHNTHPGNDYLPVSTREADIQREIAQAHDETARHNQETAELTDEIAQLNTELGAGDRCAEDDKIVYLKGQLEVLLSKLALPRPACPEREPAYMAS